MSSPPRLSLDVVSIAGSPSADSRSTRLLRFVERRLADRASSVRRIALRDLPAADLLLGRALTPAVRDAVDAVAGAGLVLVATPIRKAASSGLLKTFACCAAPADALRA